MALPKALLCVLGGQAPAEPPEETLLRASGFATATIHWPEVARDRGWAQLLPVLDDPSVQAWVFAGLPEDFTDELLSRISMLTLAMGRAAPPMTAFVLTAGGEEPALPPLLDHIKIFHGNASFAPKLAAARLKPRQAPRLPFHLRAHVDPLIGQWLEAGPAPGEVWNGFTAGVVDAQTQAFGVGPRGVLPQKCVLNHPQSGIKGEWGDQIFSACAARNAIDQNTACYLKVEDRPRIFFITDYPDDKQAGINTDHIRLVDLF